MSTVKNPEVLDYAQQAIAALEDLRYHLKDKELRSAAREALDMVVDVAEALEEGDS